MTDAQINTACMAVLAVSMAFIFFHMGSSE